METMLAFAMGEAHRHCKKKVFDWDKAARRIKEEKPDRACAGLEEDWEWTGDCIYDEGNIPKESYCYLSSTWATPVLMMDGGIEECWVMEDETQWNEGTYWPDSARKILVET